MKVRDIMMDSPKSCRHEDNLATAVKVMWDNDCGFLPVIDLDCCVTGVITDRDICIALGTRNLRASEVSVSTVMTEQVYVCDAEDDIHSALESMEKHEVRRLPVVSEDGKLIGVLSIGDITLHAEKKCGKSAPELSTDEVMEAFQGIRARQLVDQLIQV